MSRRDPREEAEASRWRQTRFAPWYPSSSTGREPWTHITDRPGEEPTTAGQEAALRDIANQMGFKDLRGLNNYMRGQGWDYYDILQEKYR